MSKTFVRIWLCALLACALFLRVHGAGAYYYSADEALHVNMAQGKTPVQVWQFSLYETHPPLGNILRHYWMKLGTDPWLVRSQSLLFGIGLILVYYTIGRRLDGELCGMCCATMVAFSQGCIIQSYVTRNYALFLLCISLVFYWYLRWRETRGLGALLGYGMCGCLACATHFSGVFCIVCIALCGLPGALKARAHIRWMAVNAAVIALALTLIMLWQPVLDLTWQQYFNISSLSASARIFTMLLYPLSAAAYLFPNPATLIPLACAFTLMALWPGSAALRDKTLQFLLALMACTFLLGMTLFILNIYTSIIGKHILWTFTFIIPVLGWFLSDACTRLAHHSGLRPAYFAVGVFAVSLVLYSPAARYANISEYAMTRAQYDAVRQFYATLGSSDLIVMQRDDAGIFANFYSVLGNDAFTGTVHATAMPYLNTRILFNPFYRRLNEGGVFSKTLMDAEARHILDGVDRLVFLYSLWPHSAIAQLILCAPLSKEIFAFPPEPPGHYFTREELEHDAAVLVVVRKEVFFSEVLPAAGKAHDCLK